MSFKSIYKREGDLVNNLKAEMARRNLTSKDLATLIKMRPNTLRQKILGYSEFSISEAFAISKALGNQNIEYLFSKDGDLN